MRIPDEAVEAAAKVVLQYIDLQLLEHDQERKMPNEAAREILEAAAPHMLADAWEEGEYAGALNLAGEECPGSEPITNPYRIQP